MKTTQKKKCNEITVSVCKSIRHRVFTNILGFKTKDIKSIIPEMAKYGFKCVCVRYHKRALRRFAHGKAPRKDARSRNGNYVDEPS